MSAEIKSGTEGSAVSHQVAGPVEACPSAEHHGEHEWLVNGALRRYCPGDPVPSETVERPPWRFDVPEVPARVTAVEDGMGWTWVRDGAAWLLWGRPASYRIYDRDLIGRLPLVECEDPRADRAGVETGETPK